MHLISIRINMRLKIPINARIYIRIYIEVIFQTSDKFSTRKKLRWRLFKSFFAQPAFLCLRYLDMMCSAKRPQTIIYYSNRIKRKLCVSKY